MEPIGFHGVVILLGVAVVLVALFRYLRLPQLLAYLCAGIFVGPHGMGWIPDLEGTRYIAEFGLVFLMFTIGLEFSLPKLIAMKTMVFGLGGARLHPCARGQPGRDPRRGGEDLDDGKDTHAYQERLHSITLPAGAYAVGRLIADLHLEEAGVSAVRCGGIRAPEPSPETKLAAGGELVLYGAPEALEQAEKILLEG